MYQVETNCNIELYCEKITEIDSMNRKEIFIKLQDVSMRPSQQKIMVETFPDHILINELKRRYEMNIEIFGLNE